MISDPTQLTDHPFTFIVTARDEIPRRNFGKFLRVSSRKHCSRDEEFLSAVTIFRDCVTRSMTDARNLVQLRDADSIYALKVSDEFDYWSN